jgi:atypical dual specificity phosphatase
MRRDVRGRPPDLSRVASNLLVGEYPRVADVGWLKTEHGVTAVVSLQHESDLWAKGVSLAALEEEYRRHAIEFRRVPVEDYDEADLDASLSKAVMAVDELLSEGHTVLLHCNAGYNRAPTVAIAYLCEHEKMPLATAVEHLKSRRPCVPYLTMLRRRFP